jgi:hypothetical protein
MMWFQKMELQAPEGKGVFKNMNQWTENPKNCKKYTLVMIAGLKEAHQKNNPRERERERPRAGIYE